MNSAPSVNYPVGRSRFSGALALATWLLGAAAAALWWVGVPASSWRGGVVLAVLVVAGAMAGLSWWRSAAGELGWNGEAWSWTERRTTREGAVTTCLDLQQWLLLRWAGQGVSRWLWLEQSRAPARWDDLRRAVYSRARAQPLHEGKPPAAST